MALYRRIPWSPVKPGRSPWGGPPMRADMGACVNPLTWWTSVEQSCGLFRVEKQLRWRISRLGTRVKEDKGEWWEARQYHGLFSFSFWPRWVIVAARGLSLVASSGGYSSLRCVGFSSRWLLLLQSTGSRCVGFSSCGSQAQ